MKGKTIAVGVLCALVAGTGTATAGSLLTGADIKDNSITGADVRGLSYADLTSGLKNRINQNPVINAPKGDAGAAGKDGAPGAAGKDGVGVGEPGADGAPGEVGPAGAPGLSGYEMRTYDYIKGVGHRVGKDGAPAGYGGAGNSSVATVACSSQNKVATGGGYFIRNGTSEVVQSPEADSQGVGVVASFPGRMDWDGADNVGGNADDNVPFANRLDGWVVQFNGNGGPAFDVTLYVICVNAE